MVTVFVEQIVVFQNGMLKSKTVQRNLKFENSVFSFYLHLFLWYFNFEMTTK